MRLVWAGAAIASYIFALLFKIITFVQHAGQYLSGQLNKGHGNVTLLASHQSAPTSFPKFGDLPPEIRWGIWGFAIAAAPHIIQIYCTDRIGQPHKLELRSHPPSVLHACQESRAMCSRKEIFIYNSDMKIGTSPFMSNDIIIVTNCVGAFSVKTADHCSKDILKIIRFNTLEAIKSPNELKSFIGTFPELVRHTWYGRTLLNIAAEIGSPEALAILLEPGSDVNHSDDKGRTPLHHATAKGNVQNMRQLIAYHADVSAADVTGNSPLHLAAGLAVEAVSHPIEANARTNDETSTVKIVKELLEAGAQVDICNGNGWSPLHAAAGNLEVAELLVKYGADVNHPANDGQTPLHLSISDPKVTAFLLKNGANPNVKNEAGYTPLGLSLKWNLAGTVKEFLSHEGCNAVNIHERNGEQFAAIHLAIMYCGTDVVELLFKKGANFKSRTATGSSCLALAIERNPEMTAVFLGKGADAALNIIWDDPDLETAYWLAMRRNQPDSVDMLVNTAPRLLDGVSAVFDRLESHHMTATGSILNLADCHEKLFEKCLSVLDQRPIENKDPVLYAMTLWAYHLSMASSEKPLRLLSEFLEGSSILDWVVLLAQNNRLEVLVSSSKSMILYADRMNSATNPRLQPRELNLLKWWAADLPKILLRFGRDIMANPNSIYLNIPPFCPESSIIYQHFEQRTPRPHPLSVKGISNLVWGDVLAKILLRTVEPPKIKCSGDYFAILTGHDTSLVTLHNSTTLEAKQTLTHGEFIYAIDMSTNSNLLVTYGKNTTRVWSVNTGEVLHEIINPTGIRVIGITFSAGDDKLILGCGDGLIRVAQLTDATPIWLLMDNTTLERPSYPHQMAFDYDASSVAIAYSGHPLCVWATKPSTFIRQYTQNVDCVIWHPNSKEVLGLTGESVFRWNPHNDAQQELQDTASKLACSPNGRVFATSRRDSPAIKLYDFHRYTLICQLSLPDMIDNKIYDICFSPDNKRLYDLRGPFCNILEPVALDRLSKDSEEEREDGTEAASILTTSATEEFAEVMAIQFQEPYLAIGDMAGVVNVIDCSEDDPAATELWRPSPAAPITLLNWSGNGHYLACLESGKRVRVLKVRREDSNGWTAIEIYKIDTVPSLLEVQILLNSNGEALLVQEDYSVTVWQLGLPPISGTRTRPIPSSSAKWAKLPTDSRLLMACSLTHVHVYRWDDLSEIYVFKVDGLPLSTGPNIGVGNIFTDALGEHLLVDIVYTTSGAHLTFLYEYSAMTPSAESQPHFTLMQKSIPQEIQGQIEIPLGILNQQLVFLDKKYWICSWPLGASSTTKEVQRLYLVPRYWLSGSLEMCALLSNGKFVFPNNGKLAIVKSEFSSVMQ